MLQGYNVVHCRGAAAKIAFPTQARRFFDLFSKNPWPNFRGGGVGKGKWRKGHEVWVNKPAARHKMDVLLLLFPPYTGALSIYCLLLAPGKLLLLCIELRPISKLKLLLCEISGGVVFMSILTSTP